MVVLGGEGGDQLTGGATEDALVDGAGNDVVVAAAGDDAVPNNGGTDALDAGPGEDLFISNSVCEGDSLEGGADRDNANWANFGSAVAIDLATQRAGLVGGGGQPSCASGTLTHLSGIEDIEGTSLGDVMVGDAGPNQLLGRPGPDTYHAGDGNDSILANSGTPVPDPDPTIDCGAGFDTAQIDRPENGPDATPIDCEAVEERDPEQLPPARHAPRSRSTGRRSPRQPRAPGPRSHSAEDADRPPARARSSSPRAAGAARSSSPSPPTSPAPTSAAGSTASRSPLPLAALLQGRARPPTRFRVFAIDAAGNRDRSPALFAFRVRRPASGRWSRSRPRRGRTRPAPRPRPARRARSATITSWAMRSPGATRKTSAGSVLSSRTLTSPR